MYNVELDWDVDNEEGLILFADTGESGETTEHDPKINGVDLHITQDHTFTLLAKGCTDKSTWPTRTVKVEYNDVNMAGVNHLLLGTPPTSDLVTVKTLDSGDNTVRVGDTVSFLITVNNNGPDQATNVSLADTLPAGITYVSDTPSAGTAYDSDTGIWNIGTLDNVATAGTLTSTATLVLTGTVDAGQQGNQITNITTAASGDQVDPGTDGDDLSETITVEEGADLVTVKTLESSDATPSEGSEVSFKITVTNNGPAQATNVSLTDMLPGGISYESNTPSTGTSYASDTGVWTIGTMDTVANAGTVDSSAVATLVLTGTVDAGQVGNTITNTTTAATADQFDPTTDGDDLEESVTVENDANLVTVKTLFGSQSATPAVGDDVTFQIVVTNNGPFQATNVTLTDLLPDGLTYQLAAPAAGTSYEPGNGVWTIGTLDSGSYVQLLLDGKVDVGEEGNEITNTTTAAAGDQNDPTTDGDDLSESVTVLSAP